MVKRKLPWILGGLLVLVAVGYFCSALVVGSIVKTGVNQFAPSITKTSVHLEGARLSPLSGSGTLTGLLVGNPAGWSGDKAFYIGKIHIGVVPTSIFSDCIVLKDVTVDSPEFTYETRVVSSNIGELLKNIQGSSSDKANAGAPTDKAGKPLKFIIRHFAMTNGRVTLGIGPTALTLPMPPVVLDDIGVAEQGVSANELAVAVMRSVTGGVVKATTDAAGKIGSTMGAAAGSSAKSAGDALKGLFGKDK